MISKAQLLLGLFAIFLIVALDLVHPLLFSAGIAIGIGTLLLIILAVSG